MSSQIAAFFDLDHTLLAVNSGSLWLKHLRKEGRIGLGFLAKGVVGLVGYRMNWIDARGLSEQFLERTGQGVHVDDATREVFEWYHREVAPTVTREARASLEQHRAQGHRLVLLSSTSPFQARAVAEHLKLDDILCSEFEVKDERLTGRFSHFCYGAGKVESAAQFAAAHGIRLADSYFYTDSATDLPMLEAVGHPRVINPDGKLRRIATKRGWPQAQWRSLSP